MGGVAERDLRLSAIRLNRNINAVRYIINMIVVNILTVMISSKLVSLILIEISTVMFIKDPSSLNFSEFVLKSHHLNQEDTQGEESNTPKEYCPTVERRSEIGTFVKFQFLMHETSSSLKVFSISSELHRIHIIIILISIFELIVALLLKVLIGIISF